MDILSTDFQVALIWVAEYLFVVSLVLLVAGMIFKKPRLISGGVYPMYFGILLQFFALAARWRAAGHAPYNKVFEVFTSDVLVGLLVVAALIRWKPQFSVVAAFVLPVVIPIQGWALISDPSLVALPPTFRSPWLVIHILFAKLAFGAILLAFSFASLYLMKAANFRELKIYTRIPDLEWLDLNGARCVAFGFVFLGLMMVAGAIWAEQAWGRYWNWDAIETWSLFLWLLYGAFLHLRLTYDVKGRLSQLLIIGVMVFSLFFEFGTTYLIPTIHSIYLR